MENKLELDTAYLLFYIFLRCIEFLKKINPTAIKYLHLFCITFYYVKTKVEPLQNKK